MMSRTLTDTSEDRGTGTEWVHNRTSIGNRKKKRQKRSICFVGIRTTLHYYRYCHDHPNEYAEVPV